MSKKDEFYEHFPNGEIDIDGSMREELIEDYIKELEERLAEKDLYIETLKYNLNDRKKCNCIEKSIFELGRSQ